MSELVSDIHTLSDLEELGEQIAASHDRDVWFFKHSLTCGVSDAAWREIERFVAATREQAPRFCLIEIQPARPVSNALAERLEVRHQSPQAILVRAGKAVWHCSHWDITEENLVAAG